jgi:putative SOS response-associated peptidase YedK
MTYLGVAQHGVAKLPIHLVSNRHHFIEHDAEINIAKIHLQGVEDTDLQHSRWGFKREDGKLLFNARAESITDVNFWKESFSLRRCIIPADSFFEWQKSQKAKNRNLGTPSEIETYLEWQVYRRLGRIRRPINGKTPSRS